MNTISRTLLGLVLALLVASPFSFVLVHAQGCEDSAGTAQPCPYQPYTDDPNQSSSNTKYYVDIRLQDGDKFYPPDSCYTSIYGYKKSAQAKEVGDDVVGWGNYESLETQQFVYTSDDTSGTNWGLGKWNYWLYLDTRIPNVAGYRVSFLGNIEGEYVTDIDFKATTEVTPTSDPTAFPVSKGISIPVADWIAAGWAPKYGTYETNPVHISIIPLDSKGEWIKDSNGNQETALVVYLNKIPVSYEPTCDPNGGNYDPDWEINSNVIKQWCTESSATELCCYFKAKNPENTLTNDWPGVQDPTAGDCNLFKPPYLETSAADPQGYWISTLNNMIKNNPKKNIKVILGPKTTIDFPLSNVFVKNDGSGYLGYDVGTGRITLDGFGRVNGFAASKLFNSLNQDQNALDTNAQMMVYNRLMWVTGDGQSQGNNAWNHMKNDADFSWFDGTAVSDGTNNGIASRYGINVEHLQIGYAAPVTDSPVMLGDFRGMPSPSQGNMDDYGASVLARDLKFQSFSKQADGISMKNPASYGSGLFIHGADDIFKTYTSFPESWWIGSAITFWGGFGSEGEGGNPYGSLTCPCCFGPGGGFASPFEINKCEFLTLENVVVPILQAATPKDDTYGGISRGLITTRWFVDWGTTHAGKQGYTVDNRANPISVKTLYYRNFKILENGWNYINMPIVNWIMNSPVDPGTGLRPPGPEDGVSFYKLDSVPGTYAAVEFDFVTSLVRGDFSNYGAVGYLEYNTGAFGSPNVAGIDDSMCYPIAGRNEGPGCIVTTGLLSKMLPDVCLRDATGDGVGYNEASNYVGWGVCPAQVNTPADPNLCYGYNLVRNDGVPLTFEQFCGPQNPPVVIPGVTPPGGVTDFNGVNGGGNPGTATIYTASVYNDFANYCASRNPYCGLGFPYDPFPFGGDDDDDDDDDDDWSDWDDDWSDWDDDCDDDDHHSRERRSSSRSSSRSRSSVRSRSGSLLRSRSRSFGRNVGRN